MIEKIEKKACFFFFFLPIFSSVLSQVGGSFFNTPPAYKCGDFPRTRYESFLLYGGLVL